MSERVRELVDAMVAGSASGMEAAFQDAMAEKLSVKLDDMRVNVAQNMFRGESGAVVEDESVEEFETEETEEVEQNAE